MYVVHDGTFKIIRRLFTQLLTNNVFVRSGDCAKQVPLVFSMMSGRTMNDYEQVNKESEHDSCSLYL